MRLQLWAEAVANPNYSYQLGSSLDRFGIYVISRLLFKFFELFNNLFLIEVLADCDIFRVKF